jgi:osmotically-inducible protein OsmY
MQRSGQVQDKRVSQKVQRRISSTGMGLQSKITVQVRNADVTLSGTLQCETQRRFLVQAVRSVEGVRAVTDQLQVKAVVRKC